MKERKLETVFLCIMGLTIAYMGALLITMLQFGV